MGEKGAARGCWPDRTASNSGSMPPTLEAVLSMLMLGTFIWVLLFQVPKARRECDWFPLLCSLATAFVALLGWLLIGTGTRS